MISENIRKYRKANNLSQDDLAELLNVSRQSISLWENGQTQPTLENVVALAKVFGVSTDALLVSYDEPETAPADPAPSRAKSSSGKIGVIIPIILIAALFVGVILIISTLAPQWSAKKPDPAESKTEISQASEQEEESEEVSEEESANETESQIESRAESKTESKQESKAASADLSKLYSTLKSYVINHGKTNGDYTVMTAYASEYGGDYEKDFSLWYWGDTDTVEFSIHETIDSTFAMNVYLQIPKSPNGKYHYIASYYYRSSGAPVMEAEGNITASSFTRNYPLSASQYTGSTADQTEFMEHSRQNLCELLDCMKSFLKKNNTGYTFTDLGFTSFK